MEESWGAGGSTHSTHDAIVACSPRRSQYFCSGGKKKTGTHCTQNVLLKSWYDGMMVWWYDGMTVWQAVSWPSVLLSSQTQLSVFLQSYCVVISDLGEVHAVKIPNILVLTRTNNDFCVFYPTTVSHEEITSVWCYGACGKILGSVTSVLTHSL